MENNEQINPFDEVEIKDNDIVGKGISSLRDAPNRKGGFGTNSFSAEDLKARFDSLPKLIIERFNALISHMQNGDLGDHFKIDGGGDWGVKTLRGYLEFLDGNAKMYASKALSLALSDTEARVYATLSSASRDASEKAAEAEGAAKAYADTKASEAEGAAKDHADEKASEAEVTAKAYADTKAAEAEVTAKAYADTKASEAEGAAKAYADEKASEAEGVAAKYADEKVKELLGTDPETLKLILDLAAKFSETRGYYFKAIDLASKKIYLSHEQVKPVEITSAQHAAYYDADFQVSYAVGGKLGVVNNFEYSYGTSHFLNNKTWYPKATIAGVDGNVITFEGDIGFPGVYNLSSLDPEDYSVYCIDDPFSGEHVLMSGGTVFGLNCIALCLYGFSAGKENKILGSYGVTLGRKCEAGYAAFATNFGNKALAHRSFASGSSTTAEEFASHTEGEGTIARSVKAQHVQGRYNIPDNKGKYVDIVGWGDSDSKRKNIHTLSTDGVAWYAKEVRVGGTSEEDASNLATEEYVDDSLIASKIRAEGQTPGTTCPIAGANLGESRSNKLFAFPANRIKLHALVDDVWTEVNDPNIHKLFTNGMQAYTGSDGKTTWRPFDNATNYLGADSAVPTAWRITLTNPVRSKGGDRYVHLNATCIRVHGTITQNPVNLRVAGRQLSGTEVTYIQSFALSGSPSNNTSFFDNGAAAAFGGWTPSSSPANLDTLYIYLTRDTSKELNKNFAIDEIHFFGRQTYVADLNMVNHDHAYKVGANGKDVAFQGKIQAQDAKSDNELTTLGQVKTAIASASDETLSAASAAASAAASKAVAKVVGSSTETLDTLEELGKALGEDPNFATTMATELGKKADADAVNAALAEKADAKDLANYVSNKAAAYGWKVAPSQGVVLDSGVYVIRWMNYTAVVFVSCDDDFDEDDALSGVNCTRYLFGMNGSSQVYADVSATGGVKVSNGTSQVEFKYKLLFPLQ